MSAAQIPNLLSLRGRGGRRGRGASSNPSELTPEEISNQQDTIIKATDTDANISRLSAVQLGYLNDAFAVDLAPSTDGPPIRRMPIINRGTYARTVAIDKLVRGFLSSGKGFKQIISLGAGTDTRYFRFAAERIHANCIYHELDFADNTKQKIAAIRESSKMTELLGCTADTTWTDDEIHAPRYHLHALDLKTLDPAHPEHLKGFMLQQIHDDIPTLILSECCLTYLKPDAADAVVRFFTRDILKPEVPIGLVLYEPINPFDAFGKVMVSNLAARGIVLQTLHKYGSLEAEKARLGMYAFETGQMAVDVKFIHDQWVDQAEKDRIAGIEMLDEVEELNLLLQHYCVAWAWRDGDDPSIWDQWQKLQRP